MKTKNKIVKFADWTAIVLLLVGGITWGTIGLPQLFGFAGFNIVTMLISSPMISNIVYSAVGLSTVWLVVRGMIGVSMK